MTANGNLELTVTLGNEAMSIKRFNMEEISVMGFARFCKNNIPLIITVSFTLVFAYGSKLFWNSIGIDTEYIMIDRLSSNIINAQVGRPGILLLSSLLYIKGFNPFTAFFMTFCLMWFFTISWCYLIAVFSKNTIKNNKLIPFALVFMTMPFWAELFYFLLSSAEFALIISLCPYVIYLLYKGFLDNEKGKIACAFILLVFMTAVYEAILPMFCCGVFSCFLLWQENSNYEPQAYRKLCIKLFTTLIGSVVVYFIISRVVGPVFFGKGEMSQYFEGHYFFWGRMPFLENILRILLLGYTLTIGNIPLIQNIMFPIMASYASDITLVEEWNHLCAIYGNVLLLPVTILFIINITLLMRKSIPSGRRLLYMLAGIGIPLCIILLAIIMGGLNGLVIRILWALPLAFAFMLFYLINSNTKKIAFIVTCLALLTAAYQGQITAQLHYSDQMRYNEDVRFAYELNTLILQAQLDGEKLPVAFVGRRRTTDIFFPEYFLPGEIIGRSNFELVENHYATTARGLAFMKNIGINFNIPDESQLEQAFEEAMLMPSYPDPGSVRRKQDFIVVRISDILYHDRQW